VIKEIHTNGHSIVLVY